MNTEANTKESRSQNEAGTTWKLLVLDQDVQVHQALVERLAGVVCAGQKCEVSFAQTLLQAKLLLPTQTDLAILLVGNLLDPESEVRRILNEKRVFVLKEDQNTRPQFYYFYGV